MSAPEVSHGRGGAGNIKPDDTQYVDGEIVRAGPEGSHEDGAYSTGRGGGGNIVDAGTPAGPRADGDLIPETAVRPSTSEDHHVGRGGAANVELGPKHQKTKITDGTPTTAAATTSPTTVTTGQNHIGLADKLKNKLISIFKKK